MAEFLTTNGVSAELEKIVSDAKKQIVLVSPYLKINQRMKDLLSDADRLRKDIRVVFGKNDLQPDEGQWLSGLTVRLFFRKNLHAKCYLNEERAIVTSMNLYEYSQQNNDEMGILVSATHDADLYRRISDEVDRLMRSAEPWRLQFEKLSTDSQRPAQSPTHIATNQQNKSQVDYIKKFGAKKTDLKPEMVEARKVHPRAYEAWSAEEEDLVVELGKRRKSALEISRLLGRQESVIERKLKDML